MISASSAAALSRSGRSVQQLLSRTRWAAPMRRSQRNLASDATVVRSTASPKAPLTTRIAWFSYGLNITLALGLYQLGQDATDASKKIDAELKRLKEDTAATQRGLRAKIAKLEAMLGETTMRLEEKGL